MAGLTKFQKAAKSALKDYLGISSDETLLVVCDENKREIGLELYKAGQKLCRESIYLEMKPREMHGEEPPEAVSRMMLEVDAVICPTTKSLTHTNARRNASTNGIRVATMPNITEETMTRCLSADFEKIIELTDKVAERLKNVSHVRVTTKLGTDVSISIKKRKIISSTGVLRNIGESGNLPSGEVYVAPWEKKTNGIIYFDGSMGNIGLLESPIIIVINEGQAVTIDGGSEAKTLNKLFENYDEEAKTIGEFGIGTNYKAELSGNILEDEKVLGTVHFAFGNNISMGGKVSVPLHLDGIIIKPTVYFDDEIVMEEGNLLI
jgi:aminopeptidase